MELQIQCDCLCNDPKVMRSQSGYTYTHSSEWLAAWLHDNFLYVTVDLFLFNISFCICSSIIFINCILLNNFCRLHLAKESQACKMLQNQIIFSLYRIFPTRQQVWCLKCSSNSILALEKFEWLKRSQVLHSWNLTMTSSLQSPCRPFKASKSPPKIPWQSPMPRNEQS